MKIVFLTDIHYTEKSIPLTDRKGEYGDIFLMRAVNRINRFIKPDVVILGGDLVDDGDIKLTHKLKFITDRINAPVMVIPGEHDCDEKTFFSIFSEQPDYMDIGNFRIIPFTDEEREGYNAHRTQEQLNRMKSLTENFDGITIFIQHVPLFKEGTVDCPYNYINSDEIISHMKSGGKNIVLSGHYHKGFESYNQPFGISIAIPALAEAPFLFYEFIISEDSGTIINIQKIIKHQLAMPAEYELYDFHIHTSFAYCNENMDFRKSLELANLFRLKGVSFCEHTGHLYGTKEDYGGEIFKDKEFLISESNRKKSRVEDFLREVSKYKTDSVFSGFEVDCNFFGKPILLEKDRKQVDIIIGALHALPKEYKNNIKDAVSFYKKVMPEFFKSSINILAHPFRIFRRSGLETPKELYPFLVELLKQYNIAVEVNFHTNEPDHEFFSMCVRKNIPIVFGSDSHNLYEVGEFFPHCNFMREIYGKNIPEHFFQFQKVIANANR